MTDRHILFLFYLTIYLNSENEISNVLKEQLQTFFKSNNFSTHQNERHREKRISYATQQLIMKYTYSNNN